MTAFEIFRPIVGTIVGMVVAIGLVWLIWRLFLGRSMMALVILGPILVSALVYGLIAAEQVSFQIWPDPNRRE